MRKTTSEIIVIFAIMKRLWIFILFIAFGCQQTTFLETENLKTSKSEKVLKIFQVFNFSDSQFLRFSDSKRFSDSQVFNFSDSKKSSQVLSFSASQVFSFSDSQVLHHENQIRLADSLYKNYLPQYNFDEVKKAMEFFDSVQLSAISRQRWRLFSKEADEENRLIAESRQLTAAKAHYYHAVGLTERDDIVGACEHYLTALEIMEFETENLRTSKSESILTKDKGLKSKGKEKAHGSQLIAHSPDYEKTRFLALIYTRLGRLFLNENYCDLAILKYRKALNYYSIINDIISVSYTYKSLGNVYQLNGKSDSALYHYNQSMIVNSDLTNKLDLEKNIAQILFDKGNKDSAYVMIKNNINRIENYGSKDSYYAVLGEMYYKDMEYDSAIFYLEKSVVNHDYYIKHLSSAILSAIYDSIGDYRKKAYYDDIVSKLSITNINKNIETSKLQDVYDNYKERKHERERIEYIREKKMIIISLSSIVIFVFILTLFIKYKSKRKESVFSTSMNEMKKTMIDKDAIIDRTNEEIKQKDIVINRYSQEIDDNKKNIDILRKDIENKTKEISSRDSTIKKQKKELDKLKHDSEEKDKYITFKDYYESDICKKILNKKESDFTALSEDELGLLLEAADKHLGGMTKTLCEKYPRLRREDLNCICLILLNIGTSKLHHLLGRNRKTVWERTNRIKIIMNIGDKKDLFLSLKEELYR